MDEKCAYSHYSHITRKPVLDYLKYNGSLQKVYGLYHTFLFQVYYTITQ